MPIYQGRLQIGAFTLSEKRTALRRDRKTTRETNKCQPHASTGLYAEKRLNFNREWLSGEIWISRHLTRCVIHIRFKNIWQHLRIEGINSKANKQCPSDGSNRKKSFKEFKFSDGKTGPGFCNEVLLSLLLCLLGRKPPVSSLLLCLREW